MAEEIVFKLEVDDSGAVKSLEKVEDGVEDIGQAAKKTSKATKSFGNTLKNLGKAAGIVGLISAAFEILKEALGNNQTVMDGLSTATTALGIVFNDLYNFVVDDLIGALTDVFEAPQKALNAVKDGIQEFVDKQLKLLFDGLGLFGKAFDKLLSGDIKGALSDAGEGFVEIQRAINPLVIITENVVKGVIAGTEALVEYGAETLKTADTITQLTKSSALLEAQQTRVREQSDRDAERQRQIRDDYTKGIDERIEANNKLALILEEQEKAEKKTVTDRIAALQLEQQQLGATEARRLEIFQLGTELLAIEAQQEGFRSEQKINAIALDKEKLELLGFQTQAQLDAYNAEQEGLAQLDKARADSAKAAAKIAADTKKREDDLAKSKIDAAIGVANTIATLGEEGSAEAKAAAVASTLLNTYAGIQAAFAQTTGGIGIKLAAAGVAAAFGIANLQKILNTPTPGNKSTSASVSTATVAAPEFNVEQTNQNQLADSISGQLNNQPVKAYVVGSEVTSQQQMDRVQLNNATL